MEAEKDDSWSSSQPAHETGITSHSLQAKGRGEVASVSTSIEPLLWAVCYEGHKDPRGNIWGTGEPGAREAAMVGHGALAWSSRIPTHPDTFPPSPEQPALQANTCQQSFPSSSASSSNRKFLQLLSPEQKHFIGAKGFHPAHPQDRFQHGHMWLSTLASRGKKGRDGC